CTGHIPGGAGLVVAFPSRKSAAEPSGLAWGWPTRVFYANADIGVGRVACPVFFIPILIAGLHGLPAASSAPPAAVIPLVLAAISFAAMLWVEMRNPRPLLDFGLFSNHNFGLGSGLAFLLMFDIMTLLLYYYFLAQAPGGLAMTAVAAGLSLVPLSVALFGFA